MSLFWINLLNWCLKYTGGSSTFKINFLISSSTEPTPKMKNLVWCLLIKFGSVWLSAKYSLLASCCRELPSKWHGQGWVTRAFFNCKISCKFLLVPISSCAEHLKHSLPSHMKRKVRVGSSGEFSQQSYSSESLIHHVSSLFWGFWTVVVRVGFLI